MGPRTGGPTDGNGGGRRASGPPFPSRSDEAPGLYVHVPFCIRACPYCDFAVTPLGGGDGARRMEEWFELVLVELRLRAGEARESRDPGESKPAGADTVYFGGGTPSLLPAEMISGFLDAAVAEGAAAPSPRVFLEANPEDVAGNPALARAWADAGVHTVSLGAQALDDDRLAFLGRAHRGADVSVAVATLRSAGIPSVSLDLIHGTRGQTPEGLRAELEAAAALPGVNHVSCYELTVEPGTPFGRRAEAGAKLTAPPDADLFRVAHRTLARLGFPAYEVSNFARGPKHRSRHNMKYWRRARYLGIGPSAHSYDPERGRRSWSHRNVADWAEALRAGRTPVAAAETLAPAEAALEELFLSLRTTDGLDLAGFRARHGDPVIEENAALFAEWRDRGLASAESDGRRLALTLDGLAIADRLAGLVNLHALSDRRAAA